jgi:hypothetical protein
MCCGILLHSRWAGDATSTLAANGFAAQQDQVYDMGLIDGTKMNVSMKVDGFMA